MPPISTNQTYNNPECFIGPVIVSTHNTDVHHFNDVLLKNLNGPDYSLQSSDNIDSLANAQSSDDISERPSF